ncbi:MAG: ABC transporter permease, partial [Bacteroidota bacterium]
MIYLSVFYIKRLLKDWTIWAFGLFILTIFSLLLLTGKGAYNSSPELTFIWVVRAVRKIDQILLIAAIFFSSELYRLERKDDSEHIFHTFPLSSSHILFGKIISLSFVFLLMILSMALVSLVVQYSYAIPIDPAAYLLEFLSGLFRNVVFYVVLSFLLQIIIQQRYVALGLTIGLMYVQSFFENFGFDHPIFYPLTINTDYHSDFVGFEPFLERHFWYSLYILAILTFMLFLLDKFYVRGVDFHWRLRWSKLKRQLSDCKIELMALVLILGVVSSFIISKSEPFYSKNYLDELRAQYEVDLGFIKEKQQPLLIRFDLDLDYTDDQKIMAIGKYWLVNDSHERIDTIYIQKPWLHKLQKYPIDHNVVVSKLKFDKVSRLTENYEQYQHEIHVLDQTLMPGDSL